MMVTIFVYLSGKGCHLQELDRGADPGESVGGGVDPRMGACRGGHSFGWSIKLGSN